MGTHELTQSTPFSPFGHFFFLLFKEKSAILSIVARPAMSRRATCIYIFSVTGIKHN